MEFKDIYELRVWAFRYKCLLRKEVEKNLPIYETYYKETIDVDAVEFVNGELIVCNALNKKNGKALRSLSQMKKDIIYLI